MVSPFIWFLWWCPSIFSALPAMVVEPPWLWPINFFRLYFLRVPRAPLPCCQHTMMSLRTWHDCHYVPYSTLSKITGPGTVFSFRLPTWKIHENLSLLSSTFLRARLKMPTVQIGWCTNWLVQSILQITFHWIVLIQLWERDYCYHLGIYVQCRNTEAHRK